MGLSPAASVQSATYREPMRSRKSHPKPARPQRVREPYAGNSVSEETSAGGLVVDRLPTPTQVLLISRYDRRNRLIWSFPKGHVEFGESTQAAALREVREETGIDAQIVDQLGVIDFSFTADARRIHKTVHHFLMVSTGGSLSDEDPEVESVAWIAFDNVADQLAFSDERKLFHKAREMLAGGGAA